MTNDTVLLRPNAESLLDAVLELGREAHLEVPTAELVGRFLDVVGELFPERILAVRVLDGRSSESAEIFARGAPTREGVVGEPVRLKPSSVEKTRLKTAVASSARVILSERWDSPFSGVGLGFAVPLVAGGELYGVLDVGYPVGIDAAAIPIEEDEQALLPIANWLSVSLRNQRLHLETILLRDYQIKLIEHANALILGVDRQWRITVANRALCHLTGYAREELVGRDLRDWIPGSGEGKLAATFARLVRSGGSADSLEVALRSRDGEAVRTVWSIAAIGRPIQMLVGIGQDQTRLLDLQSQIIQAEKLATLGQLAAGVVHELNNPLTSISVYAEYLLKRAQARQTAGEENAGDVAKLERIVGGAHRIKAFARDLVQYAKPTGDERERLSLSSIVRQSLSFCEHLFGRSDIELSEDLAADLPAVLGVPGQLQQVVINLVTNAVHACGDSGRVEVRTGAEGERVMLTVADSGPGISPATSSRIFEPFFTTKADGRGTGLGLSIVHNIMEQHDGEVRVGKSKYGGAELVCAFPVAP
jgi:PAS domain S-box-containing protein